MWYDKYIIKFCDTLAIPLPKRIQKRILRTARLHMFRWNGMCTSIRGSCNILYGCEIENQIKYLIPVFNKYNFEKVIGIAPKPWLWIDVRKKYERIKFLKWCEENVNSES